MDVMLLDDSGGVIDKVVGYALDLTLFAQKAPDCALLNLLEEWGYVVFSRCQSSELVTAWNEFYERESNKSSAFRPEGWMAADLARIDSLVSRWAAGEGHQIGFLGE